jgi:hypothetical protein
MLAGTPHHHALRVSDLAASEGAVNVITQREDNYEYDNTVRDPGTWAILHAPLVHTTFISVTSY